MLRCLLIVWALLVLVALVHSQQQGDLQITAMQQKVARGEMLKEHKEELVNMQDGIDDCHSTHKKMSRKITPVHEQLQKIIGARNAAQGVLTQKNSDLQAFKTVKTSYVKSMNKGNAVADRELELIGKLRKHVSKISDKNQGERGKIVPLLDSIEARIKAEKEDLQDGLDKHNQKIAEKLAEKQEASRFVSQEQGKVDEVQNIKTGLVKSADNQKSECNNQIKTRSKRKNQINSEMQMISNAFKKTKVPNSNKLFQVGVFFGYRKSYYPGWLTIYFPL